MVSLNGKILLRPYKGAAKIEAETSAGWATIKQKQNLIGLEAVVTVRIECGGNHPILLGAGTKVYFIEETLHASEWSKKAYKSEGIEGEFIIAPTSHIIMVDNETD